MKLVKYSIATLCLALASGCSTPEVAATPAAAPAAAPRGEAVVATIEVTATVTAIDQATRAVTLRKDDGTEVSFVASEDVQNLAQVQVATCCTWCMPRRLLTKSGRVARRRHR